MRALSKFVVVAAIALLIAAGCTAKGDFECPDGMEAFTEFNVYFGQEKGDGSMVQEDEWQRFLADTVTPHFPDGLTVLDVRGQWFDSRNVRLHKESTKVLNVLVPGETTDAIMASIRDISDVYKEEFEQQAVFQTSLPACAGVY